jgi:hypothetical protein
MFSGPTLNPYPTSFSARRAGTAAPLETESGLFPLAAASATRAIEEFEERTPVPRLNMREQERERHSDVPPQVGAAPQAAPEQAVAAFALPPAEQLAAQARVRAAASAGDRSQPAAELLRERLQAALAPAPRQAVEQRSPVDLYA